MIMFYEDDERIKAQEKASRSPLRRKIGMTIKIAIWISVVTGLCLIVLGSIGGPHDPLRQGLIDYLSMATRHETDIDRFDYMGFFPHMRIDMGKITFKKPGESDPSVRVDDVKISLRFIDMLLSRRRFETFLIGGFSAQAGKLTRAPLKIERLAIEEKGYESEPGLVIKGVYDGRNFMMILKLGAVQKNTKTYYELLPSAPFILTSSFLTARGQAELKWGRGLTFVTERIGFPDEILSGRIFLQRNKKGIQLISDLQSLPETGNVATAVADFYCLVARDSPETFAHSGVTIDGKSLNDLLKDRRPACPP